MPIRAVEAAVLDCFGEVFGADVVGVIQVGDGAGDLEDAVVGAGAEAHAADGHFERALAGGMGPEGKDIPNLTPANLKKYSDADLKNLLTTGLTADGDVLAEAMGEVVTNTISQMSGVDLDAMVAYLRSLPSIADEKSGKK